ncbi:class I SAM-dependent methyltransferase [Puniceicoccus vermicola]|uniref:Class I SAM-dependent methyltransferase n=1 Tax=Puniceicoccus vermicola TaxID=388746 RepID=A0A7X1E6H7_9BACT|nr:class I SAM-dependent methyltransferase [Puniceicoccus vermicola]MBC2604113.1 class I SAM-dependent methyltransferase [Puniceicoccus vermicola]
MDPKKLAQSYDQIADHWNGEEFNSDNGLPQHRRALQFVRNPGLALDIGCGSSGRFIDLLLGEGFTVEGLDLSSRMIDLSRKRHPEVTFHHADITKWKIPQLYDFITAWDSIWHMPLTAHESTLRKILQALKPGGIFIYTAGGLDTPGEKYDSNMGPEVYYSVLGVPKNLAIFTEEDCVCRHLEYDQYPELHLYFIVQKK